MIYIYNILEEVVSTLSVSNKAFNPMDIIRQLKSALKININTSSVYQIAGLFEFACAKPHNFLFWGQQLNLPAIFTVGQLDSLD